MKIYLILSVFLLFLFNSTFPADNSIKELWRSDIYQLNDTLISKFQFSNQIIIKDINTDGKPDVIVATRKFPKLSPVKGKILALNGSNGTPIWEQNLEFGIRALSEVMLENSPYIIALGDSLVSYFLKAQDGKILKQMFINEVDYFDPLAVSSAQDLVILMKEGKSLQKIDPFNLEKKWETKSENKNPSSQKKGFLSPVLADINEDEVDDIVLVDNWALKMIALDSKDGNQIWETNLAKEEYKSDTKRRMSGDLVFTSPCVVDLDGNGLKEVILGTMGGAISIISAKNGLWISRSQISHDNPMKKEISALYKLFLPKLPEGGIILQLASGDLNEDGFMDIIATCTDQKIYAFDGNNRKILWETKIDIYKENQTFCQPAIADMDGDHNLDIIIYNSSGNLYCLKGKDGSLLWKHHLAEEGLQITSLFLADINGDTFIEVIIPNTKKGEVVVYTTNATCKTGEIIWGLPKVNPQNNPVVERR